MATKALREAAVREHRSIANMIEILIREYCGRHEIEISKKKPQTITTNERDKD
jgi:hypothetical protein